MRHAFGMTVLALMVIEPAGLRAQNWSSASSSSFERLNLPVPNAPRTSGVSRAGHVMVELLAGATAGLIGGITGAVVGGGLRGNPSWECDDEPGLTGLAEAFVVGAALASGAAVYALGAAQGDKGSLTTTLAGAALPALVAIVSVEARRDPHPDGAWWVIWTPIGATFAYNLSDLLFGEDRNGGGALLDIGRRNVRLAVPSLRVAAGRGLSGAYASARLVSVSF